jgi:hypothetical protein
MQRRGFVTKLLKEVELGTDDLAIYIAQQRCPDGIHRQRRQIGPERPVIKCYVLKSGGFVHRKIENRSYSAQVVADKPLL